MSLKRRNPAVGIGGASSDGVLARQQNRNHNWHSHKECKRELLRLHKTHAMKLVDKVELAVQLCNDGRLSGDQFRVALALLFRFHNTTTGDCFPSFNQLAEVSCVSRRTVVRAVQALEAMGIFTSREATARGTIATPIPSKWCHQRTF